VFREDDLLGPLEGVSVLIVCGNESVDLIAHLAWEVKLAPPRRGWRGWKNQTSTWLSQEAWGRGEVKMDILVTPQPTIVFGLMGVQVVQDDVNLAAWVIDDDAVHEMQEFDAPAPPVMAGFD